MKTILILDASSLFHRAFYGIRPLSTKEGLPTNAVFGYINIVRKHLQAQKPDYAVAAFDTAAPTFRHKFDEAYKATRKPMPEELRLQLPYLRRATEALGVHSVAAEGFEADDILGTLSQSAEREGNRAVLVTGDRDSYQLVSEGTKLILVGTNKDEEITPEVLRERFGLTPRQLIDVKALAGDSSDNIPGVRGIGEKTAVKLIAEKGDLDGVYADPDSLSVGKAAREKLVAGKADAYRSRYLAEICRSIPDLSPLETYAYGGENRSLLLPLLRELEFFKLLREYSEEGAAPVKAEKPKGMAEKKAAAGIDPHQGTLFDFEFEKAPPKNVDAASVTDKTPLIFEKEDAFYTLLEGKAVRLTGNVAEFLKSSRPVLCRYKRYLHSCDRLFGSFDGFGASFDLALAAYVLDSRNSAMTLSRLMLHYRKRSLPPDGESDPETALSAMAELYPVLREEMENSPARDLFYEVEMPLSYVLAQMEKTGFAVSREGIAAYGEQLREAEKALKEQIFALAGEEFLIHSPKQLGRILFEKLGLPAGKKTKTGYATDAETLGKLRFHSPIIDLVLRYRTISKLHSTYVVGLSQQIREDGRIHTVFHQTLTATGRLSSAEPNLQNIPVKTELGREMRRFFVSGGEDRVLIDADYSQIELRLLAHMSGDETLQRFFMEGRDVHTKTASEIFGVSPEEVTPEMRKSAKAVNFGIVYGIGEYSLSQDLGIPMRVAKEYIQQYFALFPKVRSFLDRIKEEAHRDGFVTTLFGRQRRIPELSASKKALVAFGERAAMNAPIQGTAADIMKIAMVRVWFRLEREGLKTRLVLQVHDELILEAPEEEQEAASRILSEEMEKAAALSVPLVAEASRGKTWYDAK
ncbi:MAG: DNA polymerase I [Clostridia bacterium]|nr:DNA polymerase I [Clostridia bacterium]